MAPSTEELASLRQAAQVRLDLQARRAAWWQSYYDGEAGIIALLDTQERETFRTFLNEAGANWCALVANAVAERLEVVGFRFGDEADNDAAWQIWQANCLDADAELVQTDALVQGSSYVLVQPDEANPTGVSITPESALQATVLYEPGNRRRRLAGYKRYPLDPTWDLIAGPLNYGGPGGMAEVLVLPEVIATWMPGDSAPQVAPNPLGAVGLVELVPHPRTIGWPYSELEDAAPIQDRISTTLFNKMVGMDYGAFRQVWAAGVKIARNVIKTESGEATQVVRPFDVGANRLLAAEDPAARFGSFPGENLQGYIASIEQDAQTLAAITQTPPHYLLANMVNLAADAIKAAEAGLVSKCRRRARHLGEGWEEVLRLAFQLTGSTAATALDAEVVWADMETRSEGQRVDALVKMATLGVPREVLWQKWGASPQDIEQWKQLAAAQPAQVEPTVPTPVPAAGPPAPAPPAPAPAAPQSG